MRYMSGWFMLGAILYLLSCVLSFFLVVITLPCCMSVSIMMDIYLISGWRTWLRPAFFFFLLWQLSYNCIDVYFLSVCFDFVYSAYLEVTVCVECTLVYSWSVI